MKRLSTAVAILSCFSTAQVSALACGDVISSDTTLTADLLDCPGNGLTIIADYVTLDLNGHTIDGKGSGNGITIASGLYKVNIIGGGTVKDFYTGIVVNDGDKHTFDDIRIWDTQQGAYFLNLTKSTVTKLDIIGGVNGIVVDGISDDNEINDNDVTAVSSEAIWVRGGSYNILSGNYLLDNQTGLTFNGGVKNVFKYNHVIGNGNGILISPGYLPSAGDSIKHTIYQNKIYNNHTGIWLNTYSSPDFVIQNLIKKNAVFGGSQGLLIDGPNSVDNEVVDNYFADQSVFHINDNGTSTLQSNNQCDGTPC